MTTFTAVGVILGLLIYNRQMQRMIVSRDQALAQEQLAKAEAIRQRDDRDSSWQREMLRQTASYLRSSHRYLADAPLTQIPQSRRGWEYDRYLLEVQLRPRQARVVGTHDSAILALLASPDLKRFISARADGRLLLWENGTTTPTTLLDGVWLSEARRFWPAPQGPDNRLLAADQLGRLLIWVRGQRLPEILLQEAPGQRIARNERVPLPFRRKVAAIVSGLDGRTLVTATDDSSIKEWNLRAGTGRTELNLGPLTCLQFDRDDPTLLWVGRPDGRLDLCDSWSSAILGHVEAHRGPLTDLGWDPTTGPVTAGLDGRIRFWKRTGSDFLPESRSIRHDRPLRGLSVHTERTNGTIRRRVVATDRDHQLLLWDANSGKLLEDPVTLEKGADLARLPSQIAFNADGSFVAVGGPTNLFRLFAKGIGGEPLRPPNVISGLATALVWHPHHPRLIVAGDSAGRIFCPIAFAADPARERFHVEMEGTQAPIRSLSFSPDGERLAALTDDGSILLFDPRWIGLVWQQRSAIADPLAITFDPTGRRLAVVHTGGQITLWETYRQYPLTAAVTPAWNETTLLAGAEARSLILPANQSALVRDDGSVAVLLSRLETAIPGTLPQRVLWVGLYNGERFNLCTSIDQRTDLNGGKDLASRAAAIHEMDGTLRVFWRRLLEANDGELVSLDVATGQQTVLGQLGNAGFDLNVFTPQPEQLVATHFDHNGNYLKRTTIGNGAFITEVLGRQGDGLRHQAALGRDERLHLLFKPHRFGGDPAPWTYLSVRAGKPSVVTREIIDSTASWSDPNLLVTPEGKPLILFRKMTSEGMGAYYMARRGPNGWKPSVVLDRLAPGVGVLHAAIDGTGRIHVLLYDNVSRKLLLATGNVHEDGSAWICRTVKQWQQDDDDWAVTGKVLIANDNRPTVLVARQSERYGFLSLLNAKR